MRRPIRALMRQCARRIGAGCAALTVMLAASAIAVAAPVATAASPAATATASPAATASQPAGTATGSTDSSEPSADGLADGESSQDEANANEAPACDNTICLYADDLTPVVTASSGYHASITVINATDQPLDQATLTVATNALYTFTSRVDMQDWADGTASIPTRHTLGTAQISQLAAGASTTVTVDAQADNASLAAITTWGPKPLRISLSTGSAGRTVTLTSFLTRSTDGVRSADTPPIDLTVVLPLTAGAWQVDDEAIGQLTQGEPQADPTAVATVDDQQRSEQAALIAKHPDMQVVADPDYLGGFSQSPRTDASMQRDYVDLTSADGVSADDFAQAGLSEDTWRAGGTDDIAWQGQGNWTLEALTYAARQGYRTVIAGPEFEANSTAAAHTGNYAVSTDAGDITVLASQTALTRLAQNQPTSGDATAETSEAGQMARFIAQSAFYQMEQPYAERNLLVSFATNASVQHIDRMMTAMEEAGWIHLSDLATLRAAEPYRSGNRAIAALPQRADTEKNAEDAANTDGTENSGDVGDGTGTGDGENADAETDQSAAPAPSQSTQSMINALRTLASSRSQITRFATTILADSAQPSAQTWIDQLHEAHHLLAVRACDGSGLNRALANRSQDLANALFAEVAISPSDSINVVSETAQMPVTISNSHDYPVQVTVSSDTNSLTILTSRQAEVTVPAHGEAQVTFSIRVLTSGQATAELKLLDRNGEAFGLPQHTHISSRLQLNDMSGIAIIVLALILAAWGFWRQFHRVKDPDE